MHEMQGLKPRTPHYWVLRPVACGGLKPLCVILVIRRSSLCCFIFSKESQKQEKKNANSNHTEANNQGNITIVTKQVQIISNLNGKSSNEDSDCDTHRGTYTFFTHTFVTFKTFVV